MEFIEKTIAYIKSFEVCAPPHVHIHCLEGWLINLASLRALWQDLQSYEVNYLLTRRLNQDCLENLFGKLRIRVGNCDHRNAYNFMITLKSVVNNNLLQAPFSGNCEIDESHFEDITSNCESDFPSSSYDIESDEEDFFYK